MNVSVIEFPGSNCDHDVVHLYSSVLDSKVELIWHSDRDLKNPDLVILPGGFSYGDYLRSGAIARLSPVMEEVVSFANKGGLVVGICNGFQILCEAKLLPGALLRNINRKFLSQFVHIKLENDQLPFTKNMKSGDVITCPIAHGEGNYFADAETIERIEKDGHVVFRYCDAEGKVDSENRVSNPNGSINSIAGICNPTGNVVGFMPHPERSVEEIVGFVGSASGLPLFKCN
ncbi:MAG: phosphoribosylformylglycinamidine synthase subunit PurQ [Deltaproteobacteria bacterium]|nr:phosphoribosylformylglycinamidine synthase subunit PurQ [Deltaproteobacteria bacterium]